MRIILIKVSIIETSGVSASQSASSHRDQVRAESSDKTLTVGESSVKYGSV